MPTSKRGSDEQFHRFLLGFVAFMKSPASASVASWVQAIILILTLLYVRGQLRASAEQNQLTRNTKLNELMDFIESILMLG